MTVNRPIVALLVFAGLAAGQTDPLPERALARFGTLRFRTGSDVEMLTFSPDGKQIAAWGNAFLRHGGLTVWDAATGRQVRSVAGAHQNVHALRWGTGRPGLAVFTRAERLGRGGGRDLITDLTVWDFTADAPAKLKERELVFDKPGEPAPTILDAIYDSPDGRRLAIGTSVDDKPGPVFIYELKAANSLAELTRLAEFAAPPALCRTLGFTPDGKCLVGACGADDAKVATVVVWDAAGKIVRTFAGPPGSRSAWVVASDTTAALELETGDVFLVGLDGRNGRTVPTGHKSDPEWRELLNLAFLPDGKTVVTSGPDGTMRLIDVAAGKVNRTFGASRSWPRALAASPDGRRLATSGADGVIHVWDVATGADAVPTGGHRHRVGRVSVSADGRVVVTASADETIRIWDPATGAEGRMIAPGRPVLDCRLAPGGEYVVGAVGPPAGPGRALRMWDARTGADAAPAWFATAGAVAGFQFTPDGRTLLTHAGNRVAAWDWPAGTRLWAAETPAADHGFHHVNAIAVSQDGRHFVTVSEFYAGQEAESPRVWPGPGSVDLWETATGRRTRRLAEGKFPLTSALFAPDGSLLVNGYGTLPNDVRDGRPAETHGLCLVDPRTGKLARVLHREYRENSGPGGEAMALSADGRVLFWATGVGDVELYEVATGKLRATLPGHRDTIVALDTPAHDVRRVLSGSADTTAVWWDVGFHGKQAGLTADERRGLWKELGDANAKHGFATMTRLAGDSGGFVTLAATELKPIPPGPPAAELAAHFKDLDANSFAAREAAVKALDGYGESALPQARARLDGDLSPEARERLTKFMDRHTRPDNDPDRLRQGRAIELLEHLGTPEAKELLARLAKGGPGKLTTDAAGAVLRLARR
jgi:WD40 repeat protein